MLSPGPSAAYPKAPGIPGTANGLYPGTVAFSVLNSLASSDAPRRAS